MISIFCPLGRNRGPANAGTTNAPLPHERRRYVDRTTRGAAGVTVTNSTGGPPMELIPTRFHYNANHISSMSLPSQQQTQSGGGGPNPVPVTAPNPNDSSNPKSLSVSQNRTADSFNKQAIK